MTSEHDKLPEGTERPPPGTGVMAVVRWLLVAVMAAAAVGSILYATGALSRKEKKTTGLYYCPMHPGQVSETEGQCPICGMDLVPKPVAPGGDLAGDGLDAGAAVAGMVPIELTPDRVQLIGIETATVRRAPLSSELRLYGSVAAREDAIAQVQTRFTGWIDEVMVRATGDLVDKGQVVATVYSPELIAAEKEFLATVKLGGHSPAALHEHGDPSAPSLSAGLVEDARHRLELLGLSPGDIAAIEKSGRPRRTMSIRAPIAGTVTRRGAVPGLYTEPGTLLFEITDLSRVWVIASAYESDAGRLKVGQTAKLTLAAYPGRLFDGTVTFLYPSLDPETRSLPVRLELDNREGLLKPGMYGDVVVSLATAEALVVPRDAVIDTGEGQYVFVARGGGHFEPRAVKVGASADEHVEILEGLTEGETVVTTANFLLDSESRLEAAVTGAAGMSAPPAGQGPSCDQDFDAKTQPDRYRQCKTCETVHRGMGTMEEDCKNAIPRPWK